MIGASCVDIWRRHIDYTKQKCQSLDHDVETATEDSTGKSPLARRLQAEETRFTYEM